MTGDSNRTFQQFMYQMEVKYLTDQNFSYKNTGTGHEPNINIIYVISTDSSLQNINMNITEVFHILLG